MNKKKKNRVLFKLSDAKPERSDKSIWTNWKERKKDRAVEEMGWDREKWDDCIQII